MLEPMPNWCHVLLTVSGEQQDLQCFAELAASEEIPLSLNRLVPEPECLAQRPDGIDFPRPDVDDEQLSWMGWRLRYWGTKWDANFGVPSAAIGSEEMAVSEPAGLLRTDDSLIYSFLTAWSPPENAIIHASNRFPDLEFDLLFAEPGMDFAGRLKILSGVCVSREDLVVEDVLAAEDRWF